MSAVRGPRTDGQTGDQEGRAAGEGRGELPQSRSLKVPRRLQVPFQSLGTVCL